MGQSRPRGKRERIGDSLVSWIELAGDGFTNVKHDPSKELLLLVSVQACFLFTLRAITRLSKLEFTFTEIVLRPGLTVASGTDRERALHILEKSEKTCLVSASLSTPICLELEITEG